MKRLICSIRWHILDHYNCQQLIHENSEKSPADISLTNATIKFIVRWIGHSQAAYFITYRHRFQDWRQTFVLLGIVDLSSVWQNSLNSTIIAPPTHIKTLLRCPIMHWLCHWFQENTYYSNYQIFKHT